MTSANNLFCERNPRNYSLSRFSKNNFKNQLQYQSVWVLVTPDCCAVLVNISAVVLYTTLANDVSFLSLISLFAEPHCGTKNSFMHHFCYISYSTSTYYTLLRAFYDGIFSRNFNLGKLNKN